MEMLRLLLVAILGFLGQADAFGGLGNIAIQLDVNSTLFGARMRTTSGSYAFPSAVGAYDDDYGNPPSTFASISVPEVSMSSIPTILLDKLESGLKGTSTRIETSWTPMTIIFTTSMINVIKPITEIEAVTMVSTIEGTTTRTETFASSTSTLTYVVIVGYSTETAYTTTRLAPPSASTYTEVLTSTTTSEVLVVPTDITYTFSFVPAAFYSSQSDSMAKSGLKRKSHIKKAAVGTGETATLPVVLAPTSTSVYSEVVTIPGRLPGQSITFTYTSEVTSIPSPTLTSTYSEVVTIPGILPGESITFTFTSKVNPTPGTGTMSTFSVNTSAISPSSLATSSVQAVSNNSTMSASLPYVSGVASGNTTTGFPSPKYPLPVTVGFTTHNNNTSTITKWTNSSTGWPTTSETTLTVFPEQTLKTTATAAAIESSAGSAAAISTSASDGSRSSVSQLVVLPILAVTVPGILVCGMFGVLYVLLAGPRILV